MPQTFDFPEHADAVQSIELSQSSDLHPIATHNLLLRGVKDLLDSYLFVSILPIPSAHDSVSTLSEHACSQGFVHIQSHCTVVGALTFKGIFRWQVEVVSLVVCLYRLLLPLPL